MKDNARPAAVILAGGEARRMAGKDKALQQLNGRPLISHVLDTIKPHVADIVISVNQNHERYTLFGYPLLRDCFSEWRSPLVGIYSAMVWYQQQQSAADTLLCVPADVPLFPGDIVERLRSELETSGADCACLEVNEQVQPLFSLWRTALAGKVKDQILNGNLGVRYVLDQLGAVPVRFRTGRAVDFCNVNSDAELNQLRQAIAD